ncbi:MAG: UDP-3-O-(3-hydroxymyristoyl)glucosamine N-acyltransferase [Acidobacteriota bacterium]
MKLGDLAERLDAALDVRLVGDAERTIRAVRGLAAAGIDDLSFVHGASAREAALASSAGALLVPSALAFDGDEPSELARALDRPLLAVADTRLALTQVLDIVHPRRRPAPGVHPTAVVGEGCRLGIDVSIGPYAVVGDEVTLGDGCTVEAHAVIGDGAVLGAGAWLHPHVVLYAGTSLGARVEIHAGTVVGADGFGYASVRGIHHKVPQVGRAVLEDDVEVGALSAIDRATLDETRVGAGTKIDNLVQVGHNVRTGQGCILCGQVGVAGSAVLGDHVVLAGQVGVNGHIEIGDRVQVAAAAVVLRGVEPDRQLAGSPAADLADWRRASVVAGRLPEMARRLRALERRLDALSDDAPDGPDETSGSSGSRSTDEDVT